MIIVNIDIDNKDISILQLSDSFFPTGLYATSNGLEALSQAKKLKKKISLNLLRSNYAK